MSGIDFHSVSESSFPLDLTAAEKQHICQVVAGHESTTAESTAELLLALGIAQPDEIAPDYLPTTTTKGTTS